MHCLEKHGSWKQFAKEARIICFLILQLYPLSEHVHEWDSILWIFSVDKKKNLSLALSTEDIVSPFSLWRAVAEEKKIFCSLIGIMNNRRTNIYPLPVGT